MEQACRNCTTLGPLQAKYLPPYALWNHEDFRLVIGRTRIDYDPNKEEANRKNHGYSLESAGHCFTRLLLPIPQPPFITRDASTVEERRHEHMTVDDQGKIVFLVTTMRNNETVRVISLRRAHREEREVFTALTSFEELGILRNDG